MPSVLLIGRFFFLYLISLPMTYLCISRVACCRASSSSGIVAQNSVWFASAAAWISSFVILFPFLVTLNFSLVTYYVGFAYLDDTDALNQKRRDLFAAPFIHKKHYFGYCVSLFVKSSIILSSSSVALLTLLLILSTTSLSIMSSWALRIIAIMDSPAFAIFALAVSNSDLNL